MTSDETWMRLALREARRGVGRTSPNPAVGAVIVSAKGRLLAKGWHRAAGCAHAEIEAMRALRRPALARGATIYVTLEPCSTHGRTPPCVEDAIVAAGFARAVVGAIDPNPAHAGRGLEMLRAAGIEVTEGVLAEEAAELNRAFNKWIVTGVPLVIAKCALSLDGRITRAPGEGQWLTSPRARADAHRLRAQVDAILVGAATIRIDDPQLTVRGVRGYLRKAQPLRVVVTRSGKLPARARIFTDEHRERTLVYKKRSLEWVLRDLGKRGVMSVLVEGGATILGEAFDRRLVDQAQFYAAPLLVGGGKLAVMGRGAGVSIRNPKCTRIGNEIKFSGEVDYTRL